LADQGRVRSSGPTKSVVLLAFHYPPMIGPASERAAGFVRHLPELGWEPVVVTVKRGLYDRDAGYRPPPARTLRTRAPEPTRALAALRERLAEPGPGREGVGEPVGGPRLDRVRRLVRDYLYLPDALVPWIPFAVAGARRALQTATGPVVLMSTSVPYSAHLAALAVARLEAVPWIAEFRDPWASTDDSIRPRSRVRKRADAALEGLVVAAAAGVVVTSELTREEMVRAHPELASRAWVVRNGFEPIAGAAPEPPEPTAPLELVHAGSVSPGVSVEPLLRGLERVAKARPGELQLRVVGPPEPWRATADALGGLAWLHLDGIVGPTAAQRAVGAASLCVLLRPGEVNRQYVSAKLMDYLGARRPILGAISQAGEMARLAAEYGDLRLAEPYTEDSVAQTVKAVLDEHRQGGLQAPATAREPLADLTRHAQARNLAAILESAL
jgi:hypothetical protein